MLLQLHTSQFERKVLSACCLLFTVRTFTSGALMTLSWRRFPPHLQNDESALNYELMSDAKQL